MIEAASLVEVIPAKQGEHEYPVRVGGGVEEVLCAFAREHDRLVLVSCKKVLATPFGKAVRDALEGTDQLALIHVLPDGERGKTLAELERAATALLGAGATRRSLVVALGGGAVTDAAGFLAATFMRGIPWVAVPTTLLAMVDAAIGGKTAVNLPAAKNAVGAFHPPEAVLADPAALETLPARELASGKGEVMKYGALQPALLDAVAERCRGGRPRSGHHRHLRPDEGRRGGGRPHGEGPPQAPQPRPHLRPRRRGGGEVLALHPR
jgi:3-dehydroquinate synthetase